MPKVNFLEPFSDTGPRRVDLSSDFLVVSVRCQKTLFFWSAINLLQIFKKRGRPTDIDGWIQRIWGPRPAANYKKNRWIDNKNHEVRGLTRCWAVGPANLYHLSYFRPAQRSARGSRGKIGTGTVWRFWKTWRINEILIGRWSCLETKDFQQYSFLLFQ